MGLVTMQKAVSLSPRNEKYQFNLAQMYLNNREPDPAISILQVLTKSGNPEVATRAGESLAQAQEFRTAMQERIAGDSGTRPGNVGDAPVNGSIRIEQSLTREPGVNQVPSQIPPGFLKGTIVGVDCSLPPAATLTIVSGEKKWKMQVRNSKQVLLIGADSFSCSWSKQRVALNYRQTGDAAGNVISIEIQ